MTDTISLTHRHKYQWHPHRETVESISPNAISPYGWGYQGTGGLLIDVPIWHRPPAAYYIKTFSILAGYIKP